jgi:hypothetical protein
MTSQSFENDGSLSQWLGDASPAPLAPLPPESSRRVDEAAELRARQLRMILAQEKSRKAPTDEDR